MSFNQFMHPRNVFRNKPDYQLLSQIYPEFGAILKYNIHKKPFIEYSDPNALKILTSTLLKHYFDLNVQIPDDRLVPTLPMRLNYLLWIEDLLKFCKINISDQTIIGIDIGTGCCAIFPLLAVKLNTNWNFIGTEIDETNSEYAKLNVETNRYSNRIKICPTSKDNMFMQLLHSPDINKINFVMTNPPFFTDEYNESIEDNSKSSKSFHHKKTCTSFSCEAVVDGGELMFVKRIIEESLQTKSCIDIYTVMVGRRKSYLELKYLFKDYKKKKLISSFTFTELCQGNTKRWAFAWTFSDFNLEDSPRIKCIKPKPLVYFIPTSIACCDYNSESIANFCQNVFVKDLEIPNFSIIQTKKSFEFDIKSNIITWNNQRKKRRQQKILGKASETIQTDTENLPEQTNNDILRSKRSFEEEQDEVEMQESSTDFSSKKTKLSVDLCKTNLTFLLHCGLKIKRENQQIYLKLTTKEMSQNKDSTFQIFQYLKNKLI